MHRRDKLLGYLRGNRNERELYEFAVKRLNKLSPRKKRIPSSETGLREI
jgi:hypothetical protein